MLKSSRLQHAPFVLCCVDLIGNCCVSIDEKKSSLAQINKYIFDIIFAYSIMQFNGKNTVIV